MAALNLTHQLEPFEMLLAVSRLLPKDHQFDFAVTPHAIVMRLLGPDGGEIATVLHELDARPGHAQELQSSLSELLRKVCHKDDLDYPYRLRSVLAGLETWADDDNLPRAFRQKARQMAMDLQGLSVSRKT